MPRWATSQVNTIGALGDQRLRHRLHRRSSRVSLPGHYTRHATVAGSLVPSAGLLTLSATSVGRVMRVDVYDGQHVARSQMLPEFGNLLDSAASSNTLIRDIIVA